MIASTPEAAQEPGIRPPAGAHLMLAVLIGIVVVIIAVVEYLGHITEIHAIAILTLIVGISIILGALGDRYHTRL
jgi:Flp pilus assembly protein TadB